MSATELQSALEKAVTVARKFVQDPAVAVEQPTLIFAFDEGAAGRKLVRAIEDHPEFSPLIDALIVVAGGARRIGARDIASALAWYCFNGSSPTAAIDSVLGWLTRPSIEVEVIQIVSGLQPLNDVRFSDRLTYRGGLDPQSQADTRPDVASYMYHDLKDFSFGELRYRISISPVLWKGERLPESWRNYARELDNEMDRAIAAISIGVNCGVQFQRRFIRSELISALDWKLQIQAFSSIQSYQEPALRSAEGAVEAFAQIERFRRDDLGKLLRLIARFNRAHIQRDPVDAHLDLGIVAEGILLHGGGNAPEIRYRLATRGAWLLGENAADRQNLAARWKTFYGYRSNAAHDGELTSRWAPAALEDAFELCALLLRKTLEIGTLVTDWDQIVFGQIVEDR